MLLDKILGRQNDNDDLSSSQPTPWTRRSKFYIYIKSVEGIWDVYLKAQANYCHALLKDRDRKLPLCEHHRVHLANLGCML